MEPIVMWILIFIAAIAALIKSSDFFTEAAEKIGVFFGIPQFIVGVTIVAFGTSLPELVSSIIAVLQNSSEIVIGNVVGSNITNIFLVLGASAFIARKRIKITYELIHVDLPLLIGSAIFLALCVWDTVFTLGEAILCIIGLVVYLAYTVYSENEQESKSNKKAKKQKRDFKQLTRPILILLASGFFIYLGGRYTIESVIQLADILNIGKEIIAVGAVALGTSLPELIVSVSAARKGKSEMAVGNVLGSNIFNTFGVMGIAALFGALTIPSSILAMSLPLMLVATVLYFFITQDKDITKWEGALLLLFYAFFVGKVLSIF